MNNNEEIEFVELGNNTVPKQIEKKPKKNKFWIIFGIVMTVVIITLIIIYFTITNSKRFMNSFIKDLKAEFAELSTEVSTETSIVVEGDVKLNKVPKQYKDIANTKVDYKVGYDTINKKALADLKLDLTGTKISLMYFLNNGVSYVKAENFLPVMTKFDTKELYNALFSGSNETIKYGNIIDSIIEGFEKSYDSSKIKTSLVFNEKDAGKFSAKLTYSLDTQEIINIRDGIIDNILNNSDALTELSNLLGVEIEETKSMLQSEKAGENEVYDTNIIVYYNLLNKDVRKIEITNELEKIEILNSENDIIIHLSEYENNELIIGIYTKVAKNSETVEMDISIKNDNITSQMKLNMNSTIVNEDNVKSNAIVKITPDINSVNDVFEISINYDVKSNTAINNIDTSKAKYIEEYSEAELEYLGQIMQMIGSMFPVEGDKF